MPLDPVASGRTLAGPGGGVKTHSELHNEERDELNLNSHGKSHGHTGADGSGTVAHSVITGVAANDHMPSGLAVVGGFTAITTEQLLHDCETTTGFVVTNATSVTAVTSSFTQGAKSVSVNSIKTAFANNSGLTSKWYVDLPSAQARGTYTHVALDLQWSVPVGTGEPRDVFELVVTDGTGLSGTSFVSLLPRWAASTWITVYVPVYQLTSVRSIGMRSVDFVAGNINGADTFTILVDNIRFTTVPEMERALDSASNAGVIVPAAYSPGTAAHVLDVPSTKSFVDLRPSQNVIANLGGIKHVRQFQILPEDGVTDVSDALNRIYSLLRPGDTLVFPPNGVYLYSNSIHLRGLERVTVDCQGATFYTLSDVSNLWPFNIDSSQSVTLKNPRIIGYKPDTYNGSTLTTVAGTPTISGTTVLLDAQNECVRVPNTDRYFRNKDHQIVADFVLSDSNQVASDCVIEFQDANAPGAPTATASGTFGPVQAGTYHYRVTYLDAEGRETGAGDKATITLTAGARVNLTNVPTDATRNPPVVARKIYRTIPDAVDDPRAYGLIGMIRDNTTTTWQDVAGHVPTLTVTQANVPTDNGAGNVDAGEHRWIITQVYDTTGGFKETVQRNHDDASTLTLTGSRQVLISSIATGPAGVVKRRIYRTKANRPNGWGEFFLVGEIADNTTTTFTDNVADSALGTDVGPFGQLGVKDSTGQNYPPIFANKTLTLTGTPTTYSLKWKPLYRAGSATAPALAVRVRKATPTANTITVGSISTYSRIKYNATVESSHGIRIFRSQDITIEDPHAEGMGGDAVYVSDERSSRIRVRNMVSWGNRRQGTGLVGGQDITYENPFIVAPGRSGVDIEPATAAYGAHVDRPTFINPEFRDVTNYSFALTSWSAIYNLQIIGARSYGNPLGFITGGSYEFIMRNVIAPYQGVWVKAKGGTIDGIHCNHLEVVDNTDNDFFGDTVSGGFYVSNVRFSGADKSPLVLTGTRIFINNSSIVSEAANPISGPASGPFQIGTSTAWGIMDPGMWRIQFPSTYKGPAAGLWFPRGLDLKNEGLLNSQFLSGSGTRGTNLRGIGVAVAGSATTKAVAFPTRSYTNPTSFSLFATTATGGTLTAATYRYRVAGRPILGGPVVALTEQAEVVSGGQNSVKVTVTGLQQGTTYVEGFTIYRGTTAGVYTTRFDVVPNADWHGLGDPTTDKHDFVDLGSTLQLNATASLGFGYPDPISPTAGGPYTAATDQTGYEPDTSYAVMIEPSWQTTWRVTAKRQDGFDVEFGTAAPGGGGTINWFLVR
jgi:hypothetical protein